MTIIIPLEKKKKKIVGNASLRFHSGQGIVGCSARTLELLVGVVVLVISIQQFTIYGGTGKKESFSNNIEDPCTPS